MRSSFSGFYVAKSGLQAAQANLQTTGQNMTNVNTEGYTRQRVDTYAVGSNSNFMRYANKTDLSIGGGVECTGVSQIRDPYLDVRYRMENAKVGDTGAQLDALNDLETLFNEVKSKGLDSQFTDLVSQLQTLAGNSTDPVMENIVKNSSLLLVQSFNNIASQIDQVRNEQTKSLQTDMVTNVNNLIKNIAHLNEEIKSSDISGSTSLELVDQRNTMIDELSQYANIEISSKPVAVGGSRTIYEMQIDLVDGQSGEKFNLISNDEYRQFGVNTLADGTVSTPVTITLKNASDGTAVTASNDGSATLTGGDINQYLTSGAFSGSLKMLNGKGDFAQTGESTERGIAYYQGMLDNLAQSFATMMNQANSTNSTPPYDKPLFTTDDGTTTSGITAKNISLSTAWHDATGSYMTGTKSGTPGDNILSMISEFKKSRTYTSSGSGVSFFTGSFQECVTNISTTLGLHIKDVKRQNTTYGLNLNEIDTQRTSISSVDINEEGINLIMYNQALTASSRFMTTLDEALDTIINKMGVVGR